MAAATIVYDMYVQISFKLENNTNIRRSRCSEPNTVLMKVNKPFLFVVFEAVTKLVLCGVVVNKIPKLLDGEMTFAGQSQD